MARQVTRRLRADASLTTRLLVTRRAVGPCGICGGREPKAERPRHAPEGEADRLVHAIARFRPDVIVRTGTRGMDHSAAEVLAASGVPIIQVLPVDRPYGSLALNNADALAALSEFGCNVLEEQGIDSRCIPVGVDCEVFRPESQQAGPVLSPSKGCLRLRGADGRFVVGWAPTAQRRLELPIAIEAFSRFAKGHEDAVLHLHATPASDELSHMLSEAGIADRVVLGPVPRGRQRDQAFAETCNLSDLLILPTPGEGTGLPFLEAMACGVPIIATDCSVVPELLKGRGELIEVKRRHMTSSFKYLAVPEVDHLVELMEKLHRDADLRAEYSRKGREFAEQSTWERCALSWALLIGEMAGPRRAKHRAVEPTQRVLLRREVGMGDVLMSLVAAQAFKEANPQCHVTFATLSKYVDLAKHCPAVDEVVLTKEANTPSFDVAFDFDGRHQFDYARGWQHRERVDIILDTVGLRTHDKRPPYEVRHEEREHAKRTLQRSGWRQGEELIGVSLSAAVPARSRQAPASRALISALLRERPQARLVLLDADDQVSSKLRFGARQRRRLSDLCGALSVVELAAVIEQLDLLLTHDSGPLHLAAALDVPAIAFFNEVHPLTRIGYYGNVVAAAKPELCDKWPCGDAAECTLEQRCLNEVTHSDLRQDIEWLLKRIPRPKRNLRDWERAPFSALPSDPAEALPQAQSLVLKRTIGLGDVVFALSVAQAAARRAPHAPLHFVTDARFTEFVSWFPFVHSVSEEHAPVPFAGPKTLDVDLGDIPVADGEDRVAVMARKLGLSVDGFAAPPTIPGDMLDRAKSILRDAGVRRGEHVIAVAPFSSGRPPSRSMLPTEVEALFRRLGRVRGDAYSYHDQATSEPLAGDMYPQPPSHRRCLRLSGGRAADGDEHPPRTWAGDTYPQPTVSERAPAAKHREALTGKLKSGTRKRRLLLHHERVPELTLPKGVVDLSGKLNVSEAVAVLSLCDRFVGIDSGLLHAALALRIPSVAAFSHVAPLSRLGCAQGYFALRPVGRDCFPCGDFAGEAKCVGQPWQHECQRLTADARLLVKALREVHPDSRLVRDVPLPQATRPRNGKGSLTQRRKDAKKTEHGRRCPSSRLGGLARGGLQVSTKPQLLIVAPWLMAGGGERQLLLLCQGLSEAADIELVVSFPEQQGHLAGSFGAWTVTNLAGEHSDRAQNLAALLDDRKPDVVGFYNNPLTLDALSRCRHRPRRVFAIIHTVFEHELEMLTHAASDQVNAFVCVSENVRDRVRERLDGKRPLVVIRNGVRTEDFDLCGTMRAELGYTDDDFVLGNIGRIAEGKNVELIIEAVARLPKQVKGLFIGWGDDVEKCQQLMRELHLQDRVKILGPSTEVAPRFRTLDAFVLPSDVEGAVPYALMEAMAAKAPSLVTRVSDVPLLFKDGEHLLFIEKSPESIAQAALRLLHEKDLRERLATNARAVVDERLTAETMVAQYAELLGIGDQSVHKEPMKP